MIEKLYCENGQHWFQRESKRGRKPTNCPEHATSAVQIAAEKRTAQIKREALDGKSKSFSDPEEAARYLKNERKLTCQHDGHEWQAPIQRGRPPRFCPVHRMPSPMRALLKHPKPIASTKPERIIHATEADGPGEIFLREVYCHEGDHTWLAPIKRGKPPRNCAKHAVKGAIERRGELIQQKKEMAQEALQESIEQLSARVAAAEIVDRDAMAKLSDAGGADSDEETFKQWLRANSNLLHEVEALRSRERKLMELW